MQAAQPRPGTQVETPALAGRELLRRPVRIERAAAARTRERCERGRRQGGEECNAKRMAKWMQMDTPGYAAVGENAANSSTQQSFLSWKSAPVLQG